MAKPLTPWAKALLKHGGDMKKAAAEMKMAKGKGRADALAKIAGVSVGSVAGAGADVAKAYFEAEATKEVARQATHQAAVGVNQGIMHELDRPFINYRQDMGTSKKPAHLNVSISVLSAYMLGMMAEKAFNDGVDINNNLKPGQFTEHMLVVRAPLTEISGGERPGVGPAAGQAPAEKTAAQKELETADFWSRLMKLSKGDITQLWKR